MNYRFVMAAALAVASQPALAHERDPEPIRTGDYIFSTHEQVDRRPVCTEFWSFAADGAMHVRSGAERVEKSWRLEEDRDGHWLVMQPLSGNSQPDCMGNIAQEYAPTEARTYYLVHNDGSIQMCADPVRTADGSTLLRSCYASLIRAEDAG